jgi:DNA-directed RNA polymerase subunit RPC12/RpoP
MPAQCPHCGSRVLNFSHIKNRKEALLIFRAMRPMRCRDCKTRFVGPIFTLAEHWYAHCPKCYRLDLNYWGKEHWSAGWWINLRIALGAKRYRCEYCRINFASNRPRKEKFTFRRWRK